jgi:hypothetical protein
MHGDASRHTQLPALHLDVRRCARAGTRASRGPVRAQQIARRVDDDLSMDTGEASWMKWVAPAHRSVSSQEAPPSQLSHGGSRSTTRYYRVTWAGITICCSFALLLAGDLGEVQDSLTGLGQGRVERQLPVFARCSADIVHQLLPRGDALRFHRGSGRRGVALRAVRRASHESYRKTDNAEPY